MTVMEMIIDGIRDLSVRQQIEIANHVFRLNTRMQQERAEGLRRLYGVLSEEDGLAFERALQEGRAEDNG